MGKQLKKKKISWVINNFSSLSSDKIYSDHFLVGGCKWHILAYPKGNKVDSLSLYLEAYNHGSLPIGWRRHAKYCFTMVNQRSERLSKQFDFQHWFDEKFPNWGSPYAFRLDEIHAKDSGFLVNGALKIVAEIDVLEVVGKLDVTEEASTISESTDVNGFQLLPLQAKSVRIMFERHPEIASNVRPKNPNLRTGYMSLLLSLIETMCQLPQGMSSKDDLFDAYTALGSLRDAGFKLDWLENKLDQVSEKVANEEASDQTVRLQEMEEELKDLKQKWSDMEALVKKEKAKVSSTKAPISFDDVV